MRSSTLVASLLLLLGCNPAPTTAPGTDPTPAATASGAGGEAPAGAPESASEPAAAVDCAQWASFTGVPVASALRDGWVGADGSAVLVGTREAIVHYEDGQWTTRSGGRTQGWTAVWGLARDDVFAVGWTGTIGHFDGTAWTLQKSGTDRSLWGIWGAAPDDVFAVGDDGTILHYDGSAWSPMSSGVRSRLNHVWGSAPDDVLVAGDRGVVRRYDGSTWSALRFPSSDQITGLSGTSAQDVYATTAAAVFHHDGTRWSQVRRAKGDDAFSGVLAVAPNDVSAFVTLAYEAEGSAGSVDLWHYDGTRWSSRELGEEWILGGSETEADHTYLFGEWGGIYRHDADGDRAVVEPSRARFTQWHDVGERQIAVTPGGQVMVLEGSDWIERPAPSGHEFQDAWLDEAGHVIAVGRRRASARWHAAIAEHDGSGWTTAWEGPPARSAGLSSLTPLRDGGFVAVGRGGLVVHRGDEGWAPVPSGTKATLTAVWASGPQDVHAVGYTGDDSGDGILLHFDGEQWSTVDQRVEPLHAVWGTGPDDVYAGGGSLADDFMDSGEGRATVLRFDGKAWSEVLIDPDGGEVYEHITGNSARDVLALRTITYADGGYDYSSWTLEHFDGTVWAMVSTGAGAANVLRVTPGEVSVGTTRGVMTFRCLRPGAS